MTVMAMRAGLIVALITLASLASLARAEPVIVVAQTRGAPELPTLAEHIELHAAGRAAVRRLAASDADPLLYAEEASRLVASGQAAVVAWIAPVDGGYLVFLAGRSPGRALVELARVDAALGGAELERTVALKLASLLDLALAPDGEARLVLDVPTSLTETVTDVAEVPTEVPSNARGAWRIETAAGIAIDRHQRGVDGRVALALSRAWAHRAWTVAPVIAASWQAGGAIDGALGRASLDELAIAAGLETARMLGRIEPWIRSRFVAGVVAARGTSNDGRRGSVTLFAPAAGLEAGVRFQLTPALRMGALAGADVALIRRRLLIDAETIVDLGRARFHVGAVLHISL